MASSKVKIVLLRESHRYYIARNQEDGTVVQDFQLSRKMAEKLGMDADEIVLIIEGKVHGVK